MNPTDARLLFRAFYERMLEPGGPDLERCADLAARGFLVAVQDSHRLGFAVARAGYEFVQHYRWRG